MIARTAPISPSPRRFQASGRRMKPSSRIRSPWSRSRVATMTAKPASRAARASGSRCDQKNQSSVTRNSSFGAASERAEGGATGSVECTRQPGKEKRDSPAGFRLFKAFAAQALAERPERHIAQLERPARTPRQQARFGGKLSFPSPVAELSHRIAAAIALHRPDRDLLLRLVSAIAADVERIYLFLNSEPAPGLIEDCAAAAGSTPVEILGTGINMGCARVYKETAAAAVERGCDLLLQFDQDSNPSPGLPRRLIAAFDQAGGQAGRVAVIGPR